MELSKKYKLLLLTLPLWVALDQVTKHFMVNHFYHGESLPVIPGFFNLTYVRNPGVAFGFLSTLDPAIRVPVLILIPLVALGFIGYLFKGIAKNDKLQALALALIAGGAIGNLMDRVRLGYVVDSLDFHWRGQYHYPAFNIADVGIYVGVGILLLLTLKRQPLTER